MRRGSGHWETWTPEDEVNHRAQTKMLMLQALPENGTWMRARRRWNIAQDFSFTRNLWRLTIILILATYIVRFMAS